MLPKAVQEGDAAADEALALLTGDEPEAPVVTEADPFAVETQQTPPEETASEPDALAQMTHRYQTLEGKYRAEVPRLHQELRELRALVEAQPAAPAELPEPEAFDPVEASKTYLKPQEIEDFDVALDTHARLAQGAAEAAAAAEAARWQAHVSQLESRLAMLESSASDGEDSKFWAAVENHVPGAQAINEADPLFVEFLDSVEPMSGHPYRYLGTAAIDAGDIGRTVEIFNTYLKKYGRGSSEAPAPEKPKQAPPVKPETTQAREAPNAATGKMIRRSDIEKFYSDYAKGKYDAEPDKAKRIEAEIDRAMEEGRIVD